MGAEQSAFRCLDNSKPNSMLGVSVDEYKASVNSPYPSQALNVYVIQDFSAPLLQGKATFPFNPKAFTKYGGFMVRAATLLSADASVFVHEVCSLGIMCVCSRLCGVPIFRLYTRLWSQPMPFSCSFVVFLLFLLFSYSSSFSSSHTPPSLSYSLLCFLRWIVCLNACVCYCSWDIAWVCSTRSWVRPTVASVVRRRVRKSLALRITT
jgi:hypothetical protein